VTGGSWYSDQDFESEFVDVLNQQCFKFLQQKVKIYGQFYYVSI
jgi:DNA-directed RNA polymerase III subunit RPC6